MVLKKNVITSYFQILPLSAWSVIGLVGLVTAFQLTQQYAYHYTSEFDFSFSWIQIAAKISIENLIWATLSPLLLHIARKVIELHTASLSHLIQLIRLIGITFLQHVVALWFYNVSYYFQSGYMRAFFGPNNQSELVTGLFSSLIEGVVIVGIFVALDYQGKLANKERDLAKARLDALKMQIHPHFIFNTLHSISSMMDIDVKKAQQMITKVGDLLRSMLAHDEQEFVTLKEEMDFIRNYLELEQIRFQDRMKVSFKIDSEVTKSKVPSLILQPLVENCIKHGVAKSIGQSEIEVSAIAYKNGSATAWLKLEIDNLDDQGIPICDSVGFGIGLDNVEKRLRQNYGNQYFCKFEKQDSCHYKSEIRIPLEP